jgi:membrane associated rhomboid family serine protease
MNRFAFYRRPLPYRNYNFTVILIVLNVGFFLLSMLATRSVTYYLALIPVLVIRENYWWQVVTYMFLHGSTGHIFFNMLALLLFGSRIEQRLGSYEFLLYYLICGTGAGLFTLVVHWNTGLQAVPVVGASGAIYGLLLAFAVLFPDAVIYVFFMLPMRARTAVLVFAGIELFFGITSRGSGVAHLTHLAGLAFGFLYFPLRLGINPIDAFRR